MNDDVQIVQSIKNYPKQIPFDPPQHYPEYKNEGIDIENMVYESVRNLFARLNLDGDRYGTKNWNPLGELIKPGYDVVIKPNFVSEPRSEANLPEAILTHASVIRPIIDYCQIALDGKGSIVVADAPQHDSDFNLIKKLTKIENTLNDLNDIWPIPVHLLDLRDEKVKLEDGVITKRIDLKGDPKGYTEIDLGDQSTFFPIEEHMNKVFGANYDFEETRSYHTNGKHKYHISNTVLQSDVLINVPKIKTHRKAGITLCLKNMVGINCNKNYLPHFRFGSPENGGDEYFENNLVNNFKKELFKYLFNLMSNMGNKKKVVFKSLGKVYSFLNLNRSLNFESGDWHGNDTVWRMIIDLNLIYFFSDHDGILKNQIQRNHFAVVDGIVGGELDGPLFPTAKPCGIIMGGFNPVLIDLNAADIMGFNWKKIPTIERGLDILFPDTKIKIVETNSRLNFKASKNWNRMVKK